MITKIKLNQVTSYNQEVIINDLKKVNFFFGNNGSGKSTLAKFFYNLSLDNDKRSAVFKNCSQVGFDSINDEILVFDEKFIQRNFINKNVQNGIFSLNQGNNEIDILIEKESLKINQNENYINNILKERKYLVFMQDREHFGSLKNYCFEERKNILQSFFKIRDKFPFKQTQNNYDKISEVISNNENLFGINFKDLLSNYKKFYDDELVEIKTFISPNLYKKIRILEGKLNFILNDVIIGNNDVDVAKMINDLGIRNWVETGLNILKKDVNIQICPFCQKETVDLHLIEQFENYFDENYKNKIAQIELLKIDYKSLMSNLLLDIKDLSVEYNSKNVVSDLYDNLKNFFEKNIRTIEQKIKSSNEKKEVDSIIIFKEAISKINTALKVHNQDFENLDSNRKQFEIDIWNYLAFHSKEQINYYYLKKNEYALNYCFELDIENHLIELISESKVKIEEWKTQTINTKGAISNINSILKNSGFDGFLIEEKEKVNNISQYFLKRVESQSTDNVFKTLSEGEKNFIAFLYFFQLCLGSENILNSSKKKIIVIDDPVSSLDSQVLFIVTTLIHQLIAKKGKSPNHLQLKNDTLKQVIILSHNIYFYKEVSLENRPICDDKMFYHISKINSKTKIESKGNKNDILNDYSLLWNTLKNFKGTTDISLNITICNTMRRILESYINFTKLGRGKDSWDSISTISLDNPQYYICSALISEINEGSHKVSPLDDMFFQRLVNEVPQNLFKAFEIIFKEIGEPHYDAMMD